MQPIEYRKLARYLRRRGCIHVRTKGSHEWWTCGDCGTSIPNDRYVAAGTLRNIERNLARASARAG